MLSGLIVVVPIVALGLLIEDARSWLITIASICAVLTIVAMLVVPRVRWARHRWEHTDEAVYSRSGLLWEEWRATPLSRVQTVDKIRGPVQRMLGLATVVVTTASSKGAVRINALGDGVAGALVDRLTLLTEGDQRDAT